MNYPELERALDPLSLSQEVQSDQLQNQPSKSGKWWAMLGMEA